MAAEDGDGGDPARPTLDRDRHLRYFRRCFRTLLPQQYTSNDSIRMALGFFIVAGIDLLTGADSAASQAAPSTAPDGLTQDDRQRLRDWILSCQHAHGGFCGSPTHALPRHEYDGWDFDSATPNPASPGSANIAATAFALLLLALVADPDSPDSAFSGVDRVVTLRWLRQLQRPDGSFGEVLVDLPVGEASTEPSAGRRRRTIAGGRDMRYCYLAAMIRWILRGELDQGTPGWVEDVDVDALVRHIRRAQTFDGGVGESSMHESHAGYTYCALSALSLLQRPAEGRRAEGRGGAPSNCGMQVGPLARFLASRQFAYHDPAAHDGGDGGDNDENFFQPLFLSRDSISNHSTDHVAFNGRCNKMADTCYCWWVPGTLAILEELQGGEMDVPIARESTRRFLVDKTQHMIGGFSKHPGGPPDIYHAYFGLAALAVMSEPALGDFDVGLAVSSRTVAKIEAGRRGLLRKYITDGNKHPHIDGPDDVPSAAGLLRLGEILAGSDANKLLSTLNDDGPKQDGLLLERLMSKHMVHSKN